MSLEHYEHFCAVISKGPATGLQDTAEMVMAMTAGQGDPDEIAIWWSQWQLLKEAMKRNHPMVKLAAALAPVDPTLADPITTTMVPGKFWPASKFAPDQCPMAFVPHKGTDDGFWYVMDQSEMSRPEDCRAEAVVIIADQFPDGGEKAAQIIAKALSGAKSDSDPSAN